MRGKRTTRYSPYKRGGKTRITPRKAAFRGSKALRILRSTYRPEKKVHDVQPVSTIFSEAGQIINLTQIARGDGRTTRDGNAALHFKTWVRMLFIADPNAPQTTVRAILFTDKQQIADTTPAIDDLLASHLTKNETICGYSLLAAPGRFHVYGDKTIELHPNAQRTKRMTLSCNKRFQMRWNDTAATDMQKNMLYLIVISDRSAASSEPTHRIFSRTRFYDS